MNKLLPLASFAIITLAVLLSFDVMAPTRESIVKFVKTSLILDVAETQKVFSKTELAQYKGKNGGKVYLALLGNVFDVSKGRRHYGPGGGYEFFSGTDGSNAFVTGKFDAEGLVDDITLLSNSDILSLDKWKSFYEKEYTFVGLVEGAFYDKDGKEKSMMNVYRLKMESALKESNLVQADRQLFPPCNTEWSQDSGSRVWCSDLSGGIKRNWIGVPRMYYVAGNSKPRCACVRQTGPPSHDMKSENHNNNGDLDNPNLNFYPGCDYSSKSCVLRDV